MPPELTCGNSAMPPPAPAFVKVTTALLLEVKPVVGVPVARPPTHHCKDAPVRRINPTELLRYQNALLPSTIPTLKQRYCAAPACGISWISEPPADADRTKFPEATFNVPEDGSVMPVSKNAPAPSPFWRPVPTD